MTEHSQPHHKHSTLSLVSLNLLDDLTLWDEREPLIVRELERLQPDVIAFQEVRMSINNAQTIADKLGGYEVFLCPKTGERGRRDALALMSRLPVREHHKFTLGHQDRVALRVVIEHQGATWHVATTYPYWHPLNDRTRLHEAQHLIEWLPVPGVICGICGWLRICAPWRGTVWRLLLICWRKPGQTCSEAMALHFTS